MTLRDEHVKLVLPSVGILGLYLGAWAGMAALPESMALAGALGGIIGGFAALLAAVIWLHPLGRFASIANALAAWGAGAFVAWWLPWPFVQNLVLWSAVFLSVWRDERLARPRPAAPTGPPRS